MQEKSARGACFTWTGVVVTDAQSRAKERHAASQPEDVDASARLLAERMRREPSALTRECDCPWGYSTDDGDYMRQRAHAEGCTGRVVVPWPERVALAAYSGSAVAQKVHGKGPAGLCGCFGECAHYDDPDGPTPVSIWLAGLTSRWPWAMCCVAIAAGWAAGWADVDRLKTIPSHDLEPHGRAWARARMALEAAQVHEDCPCPEHLDELYAARQEADFQAWIPGPNDASTMLASRIQAAAEVAGEQAVREAIQAALVAFALA